MQSTLQDIEHNPRYTALLHNEVVRAYLDKIHASYLALQDKLASSHPFWQEESAHYRRALTPTINHQTLQDDRQSFLSYNQDHQSELDSLASNHQASLDSSREHILQYWEKVLESKKSMWLEPKRKQAEREYIQGLIGALESILELQEMLGGLGLESSTLMQEMLGGMKFDINEGSGGDEMEGGVEGEGQEQVSQQGYGSGLGQKGCIDIAKIKQYLKTLQSSKHLRTIADLLGRGRQDGDALGSSTMGDSSVKLTNTYKEEMCGITLGRDLANLLPQELAMLNDPDLELLFDLKYIQNRLFCFEKQSFDTPKEQQEKTKGAIIICVDTSSSMQGTPEYLAKALTLYLATKADMQSRACYLINFSSTIETIDLSGKDGRAKLLGFLAMSFNGGTDVEPALAEGLKKMQEDDFVQSDLIVITDGWFDGFSSKLEKQTQDQRRNGNRFYLLDIDGTYDTHTSFDTHWVYNSHTDRLHTRHSHHPSIS
ncbi:VWA domain-containing protein [Helicobacter canis]|uniref:VWA domain protein interacting with AAA ATPase n=1 Tax=Helicobacter canis TaxID=29419 RepID=A0A377J7G3_9HELI|nr:VWA domain-containing protein [Helicobacter canis]STO97786.1 VWA domain protein interacting with AAA ATPase [Helicobacter canis]